MRILLLRSSIVLSVLSLVLVLPARAQRTGPPCTLSAGVLRDVRLKDGQSGIVFPIAMSARPDSLLVLGVAGLVYDTATGPRSTRPDSMLAGFLLTDHRRSVTPVLTPAGMPAARYYRTRATSEGWDVVFFLSEHDTVPGGRSFDDGTFWYGRLIGGRWTGLERVGRVQNATVMRPNSSGLISSDGKLHFAVYFGEPRTAGGVLLWHRERAGSWRSDTLRLNWGPLSVTSSPEEAPLARATFYPVVGLITDSDLDSGSLLSVDASEPTKWRVLRRARFESMNEPIEHLIDEVLHVSWWEFAQDGPPALWYQALDPRRENPAEQRHLVARPVNEFIFLAVPEGPRKRLVWIYRPAGTIDTAEVAVVANGEPMVIGRVPFPFGFQTSGVASGDRSFIIATTPRPTQGPGPSASRTLEVRVNCRGDT